MKSTVVIIAFLMISCIMFAQSRQNIITSSVNGNSKSVSVNNNYNAKDDTSLTARDKKNAILQVANNRFARTSKPVPIPTREKKDTSIFKDTTIKQPIMPHNHNVNRLILKNERMLKKDTIAEPTKQR